MEIDLLIPTYLKRHVLQSRGQCLRKSLFKGVLDLDHCVGPPKALFLSCDECVYVCSVGFSKLSLLLTLVHFQYFAWRDVRILPVPLSADGEVKCK